MQEEQVDRLVQALNALTLAVLSMRREMAAGPFDSTHQQYVAEEESWAREIEQRATHLLEYGTKKDAA